MRHQKSLRFVGYGLYYTIASAIWGFIFPVIAIKGWHYADDDELRKAIVGGSLIAVIALMYRWDEYHVAEFVAIVYLAIGLSLALFDYRVERRSKH